MADERRLLVAVGSTIGLQARENQDALGIDGWLLRTDGTAVLELELDASRYHVIAVADGMGGSPGGRRAAEVAAAQVSASVDAPSISHDRAGALETAIVRTRERLTEVARQDPAIARLGTTVVALLWSPDSEVLIAQVGDSMAYRFVDAYLGAVSDPHRETEGPEAGRLTEHLAAGQETVPIPEIVILRSHDDSRFVLCTDGVWDLASRAPERFRDLEKELSNDSPTAAVEGTLRLVRQWGADDNASVAVVQVRMKPAGSAVAR